MISKFSLTSEGSDGIDEHGTSNLQYPGSVYLHFASFGCASSKAYTQLAKSLAGKYKYGRLGLKLIYRVYEFRKSSPLYLYPSAVSPYTFG